MLYLNLNTPRRRHLGSMIVIALVLGILALALWQRRSDSSASVMPMELEGIEALIATIERVRFYNPDISRWAEALVKRIEADSISVFVAEDQVPSSALTINEAGLVVSPHFFSLDPVEQEQEILRLSPSFIVIAP